jgi:hypothetical protein
MKWHHIPLAVLVFGLVACGSTVKAGNPDSDTTDTASDTSPDSATEPGDDPVPDIVVDTGEDPVHDVPPDTGPPDTGPTGGALGDPCAYPGDCTELPGELRFCATEIPLGPGGTWTFPGGYCSMGCYGEGDCPAGGYCLMNPMGGEGMCMKLCESASDCRTTDGYVCDSMPGPYPGPTICMPPMW